MPLTLLRACPPACPISPVLPTFCLNQVAAAADDRGLVDLRQPEPRPVHSKNAQRVALDTAAELGVPPLHLRVPLSPGGHPRGLHGVCYQRSQGPLPRGGCGVADRQRFVDETPVALLSSFFRALFLSG